MQRLQSTGQDGLAVAEYVDALVPAEVAHSKGKGAAYEIQFNSALPHLLQLLLHITAQNR